MTYVPMADAAYASNIPPGFQVAAGYYGGPLAYHVWAPGDWGRFPGFRLPIWVGGLSGEVEGQDAVAALSRLGVPQGTFTAIDMETRVDKTYLEAFGAILNSAGYKVWVYGSASTVVYNPPLNGYWVAHYGLTEAQVVRQLQQSGDHVRAIQFVPNLPPGYDASLVKQWAEGEMWHG